MAYHAYGHSLTAADTDIQEVLAVLRRRVAEDFDRLSVVRLDADQAGNVQPVTLGVWDRDELAPFGVNFDDLGLDLSDSTPRIIEDAAALDDADATLKDLLERLRVRSFAAFPLMRLKDSAHPTGFLLLYRRAVHDFSEQEVRVLQALCDQVAIVVDSLRVIETIGQQNERLAILNDFSRAISGMSDLDAVGKEVAESAGRLLSYEHLSLTLVDEGRETASLHVLGADGEEQAGSRVFPLGETAISVVLDTGRTMVTPDLSGSRYKDHQAWRAEEVYGAIVTPLKVRDRVMGTLNLGFSERASPGPDDVSMLEQLAAQLAVALDNAQLVQAERLRREEVIARLEIAEATGSTLELKELLEQISVRTAQACEVDRCTIFLLDEDGSELRPLVSRFADGHEDAAQWEWMRLAGGVRVDAAPLFRRTVRECEPVLLDDVAREDLLPRDWTEPYGVARLLSVPLVSDNQAVGLMALDYTRPDGRFSRDQVNLAMSIGSQVVASIENARLVERLQSLLAETTALYNASLAINASQDVAVLLETSVAEIARAGAPDRVRVYVAGPDPHRDVSYVDEVIEWRCEEEETGTYQPGEHLNPADAPPLGDFPMSHSNVVLNHLDENTQLSEPTRRALALKGVRSLAMVPLVAGATWLGAVVLEKHDAGGFSDETIRLCRGLTDQTALALDARLLLENARRSAAREYVLRYISTRLRQAPDVESVLQVAVQELGRVLGVQEGSAWLGQAVDAEEMGQLR